MSVQSGRCNCDQNTIKRAEFINLLVDKYFWELRVRNGDQKKFLRHSILESKTRSHFSLHLNARSNFKPPHQRQSTFSSSIKIANMRHWNCKLFSGTFCFAFTIKYIRRNTRIREQLVHITGECTAASFLFNPIDESPVRERASIIFRSKSKIEFSMDSRSLLSTRTLSSSWHSSSQPSCETNLTLLTLFYSLHNLLPWKKKTTWK